MGDFVIKNSFETHDIGPVEVSFVLDRISGDLIPKMPDRIGDFYAIEAQKGSCSIKRFL